MQAVLYKQVALQINEAEVFPSIQKSSYYKNYGGRQLTASGRAKLRERVAVEHSLAHLGHWQSNRARYTGLRKNLFDLRRTAVVHNLHVWARLLEQATTTSA